MATLTLRNVSEELLLSLKEFTGESTSSKALLAAAAQAERFKIANDVNLEEIQRLRDQLQQRDHLLSQLTDLCLQVSQISVQKDAFS